MTEDKTTERYSVYLPEGQADKFEELYNELSFITSRNQLMRIAIMKFIRDMKNSGDAALFLGGVINEQEQEPNIH